jgi:phosphate transport system permease protein
MTNVTLDRPHSEEDRRAVVQAAASGFYRRKTLYSKLFLGATSFGLMIAFIPLLSILYNVFRKGIPYINWKFLTTPPNNPSLFHQHNIGGISNALEGTALVFGLALLMAVPVSIMVAIALYESRGRVMGSLRTLLEVMIGMPSILFGIFIFAYVVKRMHYQYTGLAGSLALAALMMPLMSIASEQALRGVPPILTEAGLALGAKRAQVMRKVILPYALPRILTGLMLSASRAIGETAPVLLVVGATYVANWNPMTAQTTFTTFMLPLIGSFYPFQANELWAIALILIVVVFILNLSSRMIIARLNRGRR